jgi:hypothetical protein
VEIFLIEKWYFIDTASFENSLLEKIEQ